MSEELGEALLGLSKQQAAGVRRIVAAELDGRSLASLFVGPDRICSESTYYRRRGWHHKAGFQRALELARRDYRAWLLEHGAHEALTILAEGAPLAARALKRQVDGDASAVAVLIESLQSQDAGLRSLAAENLGRSGSLIAVPALGAALAREEDPGARRVMLQAIGDLAAWRDEDQREAAGEILDRVDVQTAPKGTRRMEGGLGLGLGELSDVELDQLLENLEAAEGGGVAGAAAEEARGRGPLASAEGDGPADVDDVASEDVDPGATV